MRPREAKTMKWKHGISLGAPKKPPAAVTPSHLGGKLRMAALTPGERSKLGKKAAAARWKKYWR
jgi:hypothetical protein